MLIQYYLADGQEIKWETVGTMVSMDDINGLANLYAEMRPRDLPDTVFVNARVYKDCYNMLYSVGASYDKDYGATLMQVHTGVGVLKVVVVPYASDAKMLLVGKSEDYARYDIDKIFEETVLAGCEREP